MYLSLVKRSIRYSLSNCINLSLICITDKLFTHGFKALSNNVKYQALSQYFFLFGQINISVCLFDCILSPPSLVLQDVVRLYIVSRYGEHIESIAQSYKIIMT